MSNSDGEVKGKTLQFRLRKGDFEVELSGDEPYVKAQFESILKSLNKANPDVASEGPTAAAAPPSVSTNQPKTLPAKFENLKDGGFFSEPKDSTAVAEQLRVLGWGIYDANDVSSALKRNASRLGLRRLALDKKRFGYTYP